MSVSVSLNEPGAVAVVWAGLPLGTECVFEAYSDLIGGAVADEPARDGVVHVTETLMDTPEARRRLAEETLEFAASLTA